MKVDVELEGSEKLLQIFERAGRDPQAKKALGAAMYGFATKVLNESKKLVPVDTGNLRSSGMVSRQRIDGDVVEVEITYGGAAAKYAAVVHEDMDMNHSPTLDTVITKKPRRGQAKYLEIPVMAQADSFARSIAARYAAFFRRAS